MTCDELKVRLIDELRGEGDERAVAAHLAACPACRAETESLGLVWEQLGRWPDASPDRDWAAQVRSQWERPVDAARVHPGIWRSPVPYVGTGVALGVLALGIWIGAWSTRPTAPPPDPRSQFVLLLYEDPVAEAARTPDDVQRTVDEYKTWAAGLAQTGNLVAGEKLTTDRRIFGSTRGEGPTVPAGVSLGGYFVIRAKSPDEAVALVAGCPHLTHGGAIELRQIDPV